MVLASGDKKHSFFAVLVTVLLRYIHKQVPCCSHKCIQTAPAGSSSLWGYGASSLHEPVFMVMSIMSVFVSFCWVFTLHWEIFVAGLEVKKAIVLKGGFLSWPLNPHVYFDSFKRRTHLSLTNSAAPKITNHVLAHPRNNFPLCFFDCGIFFCEMFCCLHECSIAHVFMCCGTWKLASCLQTHHWLVSHLWISHPLQGQNMTKCTRVSQAFWIHKNQGKVCNGTNNIPVHKLESPGIFLCSGTLGIYSC